VVNRGIDTPSTLDCKSVAIVPDSDEPEAVDPRGDNLSSDVSQESTGYQEASGYISMVREESADGRVVTGFSQHTTCEDVIGIEATPGIISSGESF
jgi:hypothetical protein